MREKLVIFLFRPLFLWWGVLLLMKSLGRDRAWGILSLIRTLWNTFESTSFSGLRASK